MKKLVASLLLLALSFAFMPPAAFCGDHHENVPMTCHHQCNLTCHHINAVLNTPILFQENFPVVVLENTSNSPYQNPVLFSLKRPPISLA